MTSTLEANSWLCMLSVVAIAVALSGCAIEGVCVVPQEMMGSTVERCDQRVKRWDCDGEWHAYTDGDGDLGLASGGLTCQGLGFGTDSMGNYSRRVD